MGHDIYARKQTKNNIEGEEIAYLRRSAFEDLGRVIYNVLDAQDCDGGCSGLGISRNYSVYKLESALQRLELWYHDEDVEPERKFLQDCISFGGNVTISFL